jgi:cytochrome c oxidase subunit IV
MSDSIHGEAMVKVIWQTFWILFVVTIVEVSLALTYMHLFPDHRYKVVVDVFYIIASLIKVYYIVGIFMHLKFEIRNLKATVLTPSILLLYAIIMLLAEGKSWFHMRGY